MGGRPVLATGGSAMSVASEPPRRRPGPARTRAGSRVLVHTGHGKGKTSAAMGIGMRAVGRGWRVCVVQFVKDGRWRTGEEASGRRLGFDWWSIGDGFTWDSKDMEESEAIAREAWRAAKAAITSGDHEVVMLDEITYPINWGWIDERDVADTIARRPEHVSVIATGRDAPASLLAVADTVTEMRNLRHAFDSGVKAIRGIDF
jgi:cob(I)alamin adenosyltransferase